MTRKAEVAEALAKNRLMKLDELVLTHFGHCPEMLKVGANSFIIARSGSRLCAQ
jgi:hypothetical protein